MYRIPNIKINILCIEDSEMDYHFFKKIILKNGNDQFQLTHRTHFQGALNLLTSRPFDIVVLDLSFSSLHCLQSLEIIKTACPHMPVIILTSKDTNNTIQEALHMGAQDYLVKGAYDYNTAYRAIIFAIERQHSLQKIIENHITQHLAIQQTHPKINKKENCNIRSLMSNVMASVSHMMQSDDIILRMNISSDISENYVCDKDKLYNILITLLGNAVKHTTSGEITIRINKIDKDICGNISLGFTIIDTGIGMSTEKHNRITRFIEGYSLALPCKNLAACKQNIRAMKGKIHSFESTEGDGTSIGFMVKVSEPIANMQYSLT